MRARTSVSDFRAKYAPRTCLIAGQAAGVYVPREPILDDRPKLYQAGPRGAPRRYYADPSPAIGGAE